MLLDTNYVWFKHQTNRNIVVTINYYVNRNLSSDTLMSTPNEWLICCGKEILWCLKFLFENAFQIIINSKNFGFTIAPFSNPIRKSHTHPKSLV